jgi:hypothetical protein
MNKNNHKNNKNKNNINVNSNNNNSNDGDFNIINITNINNDNFKSDNDIKCVGPCYPSGYLNYHPYYLFPVKNKSKTCPTENGTIKCDKITPNYKEYNIFNITGYVGSNPNNFIIELYDITTTKKLVKFLDHNFDKYPLLTCKRILICVFNKFSKNNDFPLYLFSTKFEHVFKEYYKTNNKIDYFDNIKNIIFSNSNITDIFIFFHEKFM